MARPPHSPVVQGPGGPPKPHERPPEWFDWDAYYKSLTVLPSLGGSPKPGEANPAVSNGISADGYLPIVFGRRRVATPIFIQREDAPWGWQCIVILGEGEIGSIGRVWCNGHEVTNTGAPGFGWIFYPGTPSGDHNAFLDSRANAGDFPPFTSASSEVALPDTAYMNIQITTDNVNKAWGTLVPGGGAPTFEVEILTGRKVFDHRDGGQSFGDPTTWLASDNPWLAIRDLLANTRWGVTYPTINDTSFDAAADIADSMVGSPSAKRFTTNDLILERADISQHLAQLRIACNGELYMGDGGVSAFCDVENAGAPVLALDTARNFLETSFSDLTAKDQPTQIVITYSNVALDFKEDTIRVPKTLGAGVDLREATYKFGAITDVVHATRAGAYILNQNTVTPVRATGRVSQAGIVLGRGSKVTVTSSDGPAAAEFLVADAELLDPGYSVSLRQYHEDVYGDAAIETRVPVITDLKPPWGPPTAVTFPVITTDPWCYWEAPRLLDAGTAPIDQAGTPNYAYLDLGSGVAKKMGRFVSYVPGGAGVIYGGSAVEWSDDNSSWTAVSGLEIASWRKMSGPTTMFYVVDEWTTPALAHRYWRVNLESTSGVGSSKFYDVLAEVDPFVTAYEVHNSSANLLLGTPEEDPIFVVIPAANRPTITRPLDLRTIVFVIGNTTQTARPCIVPVSNGLPSAEPVLLIEDSAAVGFYPAAQSSAAATARQDGVAMDVDSLSVDFLELDMATPAVAPSGRARLKTDGAAVLASVNGSAYAALGGGGSSPLTTKGDIYTYDTGNARLPVGADGKVLTADSSKATGLDYKTPATGTVTSVGLTVPSKILAVSGSPVTGASTLALTQPNRAKNKFLAGPITGADAEPDYRFIDPADLSGTELVWIVEKPAGAVDGVNRKFVLSQTPLSKVLLISDNQTLTGGVSFGQYGTGYRTIWLAALANPPWNSIQAAYMARVVAVVPPDVLPVGTAMTWVQKTLTAKTWGDQIWVESLGLFVLSSTNGTTTEIRTSPDGETWTPQTTDGTMSVYGMVWDGSQIIGMHYGNRIYKSSDAVNWSYTAISGMIGGLGKVIYVPTLNGRLISVGDVGGIQNIVTSDDGGASWSARTSDNVHWSGFAWSEKLHLAVAVAPGIGGTVRISSDGTTWAVKTISGGGVANDVIWVDALELFVVTGSFGSGTPTGIVTSADGETWSPETMGSIGGALGLGSVRWSASRRLLVAMCAGENIHAIWTSPDAHNWAEQTTPNIGLGSNGGVVCGDFIDTIVGIGYSTTGVIAMRCLA